MVPFTVIYHDGNTYHHKQFRGHHAQLVHDVFNAAHPEMTILDVFCGSLGKMSNAEFQKCCNEVYQKD